MTGEGPHHVQGTTDTASEDAAHTSTFGMPGALTRLGADRLAEALRFGLAVIDAAGQLIDVNPGLAAVTGHDDRDSLTIALADATDQAGVALASAELPWLDVIRTGVHRHGDVIGVAGRWLRVRTSPIDLDGTTVALVSLVDITAEHETAAALRAAEQHVAGAATHAALGIATSHDELTGLPNRATLLTRATEALNRAAVSGRPMALLLCDLDHFKLINDSRGHAAGDAVLQETAERLKVGIRDGDAVARLGGDEFAVLCEALPDREHAEQVAQRLIDDLTRPMVRAHGVSMTVSIGIALSEPGITAADLLRNADAALYRAKADGRDRHALFAPELIEQAAHRLSIEHELREAMREEALFLHYQPVRRLHDGSVAAYEALVRWDHPTRGILSPDAFLPIAEASDLVLEVDRYVLLRACEDAVTWPDPGDRAGAGAPSVSVNISARHVGRGLLPGLVARALSRSGLEPGRLTLELTETALLGVTPTAIAELDTVVALGVRLAIDDFGTGYSSLTYLVDVPAAYVKIDRSFVDRMASSAASRAIVEAVVTLCRALGIDVVAEGIEDEGQRRALSLLGCSYGQGFLLGRPGRIDLTSLERTGA